MNRYLVTGATGVVGAAVVGELLRRDDVEIHVLLRATDTAHAAQRVGQLTAFLRLPEHLAMRVRPLVGDMASPRFGLDASAYATAAEATTHIVHAAGVVRMNLPLPEARRFAVEGAKNVLALARAANRNGTLKKVEFVSTVGVGGRRAEPLPETRSLRQQLRNVILPPGAYAVGRSIEDLALGKLRLQVTAIRREGILGRSPVPTTRLREGDTLVLFGAPEDLELGESFLLAG